MNAGSSITWTGGVNVNVNGAAGGTGTAALRDISTSGALTVQTNTGGNTTGNRCTRIVADTITFSGNANLNNDCSHLGIPEEVDDDPRLVG